MRRLKNNMSFFLAARDGSKAFWLQRLVGVLDEGDLDEAASKLSVAGFKDKHMGQLSQNDLLLATMKPAVIKDLLQNQHNNKATGSRERPRLEQREAREG